MSSCSRAAPNKNPFQLSRAKSMKKFRRLLVLVALGGAVAWGYEHYSGLVRTAYQRYLYPPIRETSPLAEDMERSIRAREDREFLVAFRRVNAKLLESTNNGNDVEYLKAKMPNAARLGRERKFKLGRVILNTIDVRIPRKKSKGLRPAGTDDSYLKEGGR
ncbi:MAG: hypothetical protein COB53_01080 [Elusimicrobia bacterium]|nr:MAG: hypothetical protein COB53_01080 [Elusimicrobiota bacterium]